MPNKVQVPRISDAVASTLERRILEGSLKPGDRLPAERELAIELGVSRPSLREAIQKLASKGMLQSRQGGGTFVTAALEKSFFDPWQDMMGSYPNLREDMLEFRRMLEGQAAEWAAERATDADLQRLEQAYTALQASFGNDDTEKRSAADIAFHQAIGDASHNVLIGHLSAALLRLMHDNIRLNLGELKSVPAAGKLLMSQHAAIHAAIAERKPQAARAAAETHIDFVRETLAQTLRSVARRETAERRLNTDFSTP
ncbi:GntR family transcriptional regulator [Azonexus fungiphilus]|jgi:GntR family transcriptional repressor for pyruvate dehydrogenase complex|uniref:Pyruvate dehydrogenase complex repressor n=1 Tax=Azonexus fungiphilus TaxID=146940 RepID=A0A495WG46_9RHOO|nr:FCD domain-containing protein [Azonexus fungiphilus]NHC05744.1 FCD domain-containing protein [Azonexus fungiphilus]RKT60661.1 GntR family transcriptional regulator [Azonexus fungiphilus]